MNDMLKRGFFLGLGAAAYSREKMQNYLDDLVYKGKITPREAQEWKEELIQRGRDKETKWSEKRKDKTQQSFRDMGLATEADILRLEEKLHDIEKKLAERPNNDGWNNPAE
ncbi:polyhydroxyalkanoate synthesis regulator phasin [Sinobaca qinghaiensis]|uniref:Polyhydroxyalkanoate synthesis regulator phasin n=1 Tax=Sinobaca qinghaiensis TaxID=342944 RepID=A0A419V2T8_9BACL|nr:hypothetical protein [Sinobaca qinghaiensis]RKD72808.1 polyhydroxyalkanoate synthesis regulator phasin [Sinobaca qinghaiensis]